MSSSPSPCINVCQMDVSTGWCKGCLRTLDETALWPQLEEPQRSAVLAALPQRRAVRREHRLRAAQPHLQGGLGE